MTPRIWGRRQGHWAFGAAIFASLSGCMSWDDVTSRDFHVSQLWTASPPPLTVLEKSSDGYARAKAIAKLEEPLSRKGTQAEQDQMLRVLQTAALNDRDPLCRMAAIRTLGHYKDPRAAKMLNDVYLSNPSMSPENNAMIRQQALAALAENSPSDVRQLFIQSARQPGGSLTGAAQRDRQEILDERLTAIRALAKYPQSDSVETLVKLLETEKDVAIRTCAHDSLKTATKRDIPADGKAWREFVATGREPTRSSNSMLAGLFKSEPPSATETATTTSRPLLDKISTLTNSPTPREASELPVTPVQVNSPTQPRTNPAIITTPAVPYNRPPQTLPAPVTPTNPNQVRQDVPPAAPAGTTGVVPAGAYRNSQGELVMPVNP